MSVIQGVDFYNTTLTRAEIVPANVPVTAGAPIRLNTVTIPLGMILSFGRGENLGTEATEGRIFVDMRDNSAAPGVAINGTLRLVGINQLDQELHIYWEGRTENCRLGATIMRDRTIFPSLEPVILEGFRYALVFISDITTTVGSANTIVFIEAMRARRIA